MAETYYYFSGCEFSTGPVFDLVGSILPDVHSEIKKAYPECLAIETGIYSGTPGIRAVFSVPYRPEWLSTFRADVQELVNSLLQTEGSIRFLSDFAFNDELGVGVEEPKAGKLVYFASSVADYQDYYARGKAIPPYRGELDLKGLYREAFEEGLVVYEVLLPTGVDPTSLKALPHSWVVNVVQPEKTSSVRPIA